MGACHSEAALDPVEATADTAPAPVFWSPEKEQEKRLAKLKQIQAQQQAEIERATGHLRRRSGGEDRRKTMSRANSSVTPEAREDKRVEEEKEGVTTTTTDGLVISSPRAVPSISIPSPTQTFLSTPSTPHSTLPSSPPTHRHHRTSSDRPATTPSSSHRRTSTAPSTPRKGQWDYNDMPGARPTAIAQEGGAAVDVTTVPGLVRGNSASVGGGVRRSGGMATMERVDEPEKEEKEGEGSVVTKEVKATIKPSPVVSEAIKSPTAGDASAMFGVKLRKVQPKEVAPVTEVAAAS